MIWRFYLTALAVWRMTHLLAEEDGPGDVIAKLRARLGTSIFGRLMDCFYCFEPLDLSTAGAQLNDSWARFFVYWMALSGQLVSSSE